MNRSASLGNHAATAIAAFAGAERIVYGVTAGYAVALVLLTHWPQVPDIDLGGSVLPLPLDKIIHGCLYAVLGFLTSVANRAGVSRPRISGASLLAAIGLFAALDEVTQSLTGRSPDVWDWVADLAGAACGIGLALMAGQLLVPRGSPGRAIRTPCDPNR